MKRIKEQNYKQSFGELTLEELHQKIEDNFSSSNNVVYMQENTDTFKCGMSLDDLKIQYKDYMTPAFVEQTYALVPIMADGTEGGYIEMADDFGRCNKVLSFEGYLYIIRETGGKATQASTLLKYTIKFN